MKVQLNGYILAGGRSLRMGRDKGSLHFRGRPLIEGAIDLASQICARVFLVAPPERYPWLKLPRVEDAISGGGPLVGLWSALKQSDAECNLVLPCDMPFLTAQVLEDLLTRSEGVDGAVPVRTDGRRLPLPGCYRSGCLQAVERAVSAGERRMDSFFGEIRLACIPVSEYAEGAFVNLNSPDDLRRWET